MLQSLIVGLCAAIVVYLVLKRCAGLLLSAAARNKHYKLTVESLGPFICQSIHLQLAQGPVSHIWISEVSLGRSRSAAKVAQAAMSWQFRLPFTVRSLTIELRDSPVAAKFTKKKQNKQRSGSKILTNSGLRLLLGLLPKVPVRVKQLTVKHQATGFLLDIPRVEMLINSSRLSSKLKLDVKLLPIKAVLESAPGASSSPRTETCRLLELQHVTASVVLQVTNQSMGLHCISASVEVGNAVLTASSALLSALNTLAVLEKQNEAAHPAGAVRLKHTKSGSKKLTVAAFDKLVASLPDEVQVTVPSICVQSSALKSSDGLETSFESRNLVLSALRASGPYSGDPQAPTSQHTLAPSSEEQLYTISLTSDGAHGGLGLTNSHAAGTVSISMASVDLQLNRAVPTLPRSAAGSDPAAAVLRGHWEVCVQASGETQAEVVAETGAVLLGCAVDMVTLRAASGDGSSMKAQSAADLVGQLSLQGLQMQVLTSDQELGSQKGQTGQSVQQLKHVVGVQKLGLGMSSQITNDALLCTGNVAVTGCAVHLMHSMLFDLASLGASLAPPKGVLKKGKGPGQSISDPISSPTAPLTSKSKRPKLNVQLTKVAVGVSNVVVGYQTVVEVASADRPGDEEAPLTLNRRPLLHCGEVEGSLDLWPARGRDSGARHNLPGSPRRQASLDWTWSNDEHAAAYSRAGLPQWAAECLSEPGQPSDFASQAAPPPAMALRPAAVVQATVSDVMLTLPYDQDFGRAERFGELWSKAFGQVLNEHLSQLKKPKHQTRRKVKRTGLDVKSLFLPLELRLVLQGATVKFDHHPMEAWLSIHGPLLRDMACQEALWSRAVAADAPTPDEANSSAAAPSEAKREEFVQEFSADAPVRLQSQQATLDALSAERSRQYKVMCDGLRVARQEDSKQGALMHVAVEGAQARLIVLGSDPNSTQAAMDFIARVDPPSEGVPMRQVQKLHVDVGVQGVAVDFCNNPQPLATAMSAQFHGVIAVGRQVTAPPHLYSRRMAVGHHRHTHIGVTVKGSRALVKVYTDVHLTVQQAAACYGMGLEPVIAMVSQAGKRLSPTDPDKSRPKPAVLPWWDMMRFVWRGGIAITATEFQFSLISGSKLESMAATQRLQVNAAVATVRLAYGGQLIVDTTDLTAQAFKTAGLDQPAGTLLALPLLDFPCGQYILSSKWHLSSGRDGNQHHLFPLAVPTDPEARQGPMLPADHFKSSALDIDLQVVVGSLSTVTGPPQGGARSLQEGHSHTSADSSAIVFLGDHQVVFMKDMISVLQQPPAWLKFPVRFGTYFLPLDKRRAPSTKLPRLFNHFNISVKAGPLDVVHYTIDPEDPSNGVCLSMTMGAWQGNMLMNQSNPRAAPQGASSHEKKRQAARVGTKMLSMAVQADKLCVSANEADFDDGEATTDSQGRLMELMSGGPSAAQLPASYRHLLGAASTDAFIVSIESVRLTQTDGNSQGHRPLKALVHNCQLLVDLAGRNAIWGAAAHLFMAFKPLVPAPKRSPPGMSQPPGTPGLHRGSSGLQRGHSGVPGPMTGGKGLLQQGSFTHQGGELLQILSQQDQAMTDEGVEEPVADAAAHLVGEADGAPTDGRDEELRDALAAETQHKDDVQASQQEQAAAEDSNSRVTFEVEVVHFQAYLQAEMAPGRFLLAAEKGMVQGRSMPHLFQSLITLTLDQVQAHVAQTEVDPGAAVAWLRVTDAGMEASPTGSQLIRRVFDPFKIQLRISQSAGTGSVTSPDTSPAKASSKPAAKAQTSQGQEIRLVVPEIGVVMDSREFEVLTDVISNVGLAQGPHVDSVVQDKRLLLGQGPAEGPAVDGARDMFTYLCQYLASLEAEAFTVRSRLEMAVQRQPSGRSHSGASRAGSGPLHRSAHMSQEPCIIDELADVPTALHNYFQSLVQSQGDKLDHDRLVAQGEGLLVRWGAEQSLAAMQGLQAAREALLDLQAQSNKQTLNQNAKRFTLELDAIKWHLCQDRTPFVDASIVGVMLDSIQNKDLSGSSKLIIQKIEVKDRQGLVGEAPGLEPGMVVSAWNPDESWAKDALLRVNATKGVPTAELTVWSLVDVMVHPLGVHIHQQVANSLWEYFFPKEDTAAKQRQQQWVKSVASRRKSAAVTGEAAHGGFPATSKSGLGGSGHSRGEGGSGSTTSSAAADKAVSAVSQGGPPGSPTSPSATSPVFSLGRRSRHRRISSWDANLEGRKGVDPSLISPASSGDLTATRSKASGSVFRRLHKRSASHGEELSSAGGLSASGSGAARPPSAKKASQKAVIKQKKLLFVHFAINRVHCRVTYKGAPFNIKDFKVLLDAQVYEDLEGRWVDLFNRMKWDIIKSVLKSVAGLQGRKFKELLPDHLLTETKSTGDKGKGTGKQWPFGWGKKKGDKEHEALPNTDAEVLKARQKKKMMFGEQHLVRFGSMTKPKETDTLGEPQDAMDPQQASTSSSTAAEAAPTAASRARAFVNRALASASQGPKSSTPSASDRPHSPDRLQPLPQGALSSTPSLAEMLSDLHPAGSREPRRSGNPFMDDDSDDDDTASKHILGNLLHRLNTNSIKSQEETRVLLHSSWSRGHFLVPYLMFTPLIGKARLQSQGSLPVPRRPAPSRPGMESVQPPEAQGSIPVPRRPAPSRPDLAPALPLQEEGGMPSQLASSRSSQAADMPVESQSSMSVPVQWHDTSRPSSEAALPLEGWDGTGRQPQLPTNRLPQVLPSRQVLAARQRGPASQAERLSQSQGSGQTQGPEQMQGLEGMLGRAAPDSEEEEEDSETCQTAFDFGASQLSHLDDNYLVTQLCEEYV
ncbi:hypothetical protein WJX79_003167 [Trebouxia sp. C0005]